MNKIFVLDKSDFVLDKKYFVWADGQGIRQKTFCPGQNYIVLYKYDFVQDKKYFVWANGQGITVCWCFIKTFTYFVVLAGNSKRHPTMVYIHYYKCTPWDASDAHIDGSRQKCNSVCLAVIFFSFILQDARGIYIIVTYSVHLLNSPFLFF